MGEKVSEPWKGVYVPVVVYDTSSQSGNKSHFHIWYRHHTITKKVVVLLHSPV